MYNIYIQHHNTHTHTHKLIFKPASTHTLTHTHKKVGVGRDIETDRRDTMRYRGIGGGDPELSLSGKNIKKINKKNETQNCVWIRVGRLYFRFLY
jgi:hypothetical protein